MRRYLAIRLLCLVTAVGWLPTFVIASDPVPHVSDVFNRLRPLVGDLHIHCSYCDGHGPGSDPRSVLLTASLLQDFCFLTPHGEQLSKEEFSQLLSLAAEIQSLPRLVDIGQEVTGTPDYLRPDGSWTFDPAYTAGWGHMLIFGSAVIVGQGAKDGLEPQAKVPTFKDFLTWLGKNPGVLAAFAHPERYMEETSFGGFAGPPAHNRAVVEQVFGCELSHLRRNLVHGGPGDGNRQPRASNEAGWRELLRGGWRVAPLMTSDCHLFPYRAGPWTVAYAYDRSLASLYEAFWARRLCASEYPGASVKLVAWTRSSDAQGREFVTGPVAMGSRINLRGTMMLYLEAKVEDMHLGIREQTVVVVGRTKELDHEFRRTATTFPRPYHLFDESYSIEWFRRRGATALYLDTVLGNGSHVVSAPFFLEY